MSSDDTLDSATKAVRAHCVKALAFEQEALHVEGLMGNAPNDEARATLKVISESWRGLAELHRRLERQWR